MTRSDLRNPNMECYFNSRKNKESGKTDKLNQEACQIGKMTICIQEAIKRNVREELRVIISLVNEDG